MRKQLFIFLIFSVFVFSNTSIFGAKILFDYTKDETAGNADWVIDDNYPIPQPSNPTNESDWTGGISAWAYDMYLKGHECYTLTTTYGITYGNSNNSYDLSNFDVFVVCEPQNPFTTDEITAILNFVQNGGGLFIVSDHDSSDRNNNGWDSPHIWNDFGTDNYFGFHFQVDGEANDNITSTNPYISSDSSDTIIHGPNGDVSTIEFHNGTTITLNLYNNNTAQGHIWYDSSHNYVMFATAEYGKGKVCAVGDSSPADDGTGDPGDTLYYGWDEGNDREAFLNGMDWLLTPNCDYSDTTPPDWATSGIANLTVTPGDGQNSLSWDSATDSENPNSVKYAIYRANTSGFTPSSSTLIDTGLTTTSYLDINLINGITYYYRVETYNCNGNYRYNTDEGIGIPKNPNTCDTTDTTAPDWANSGIANLTVTPGDGQNSLSWDSATDSENPNSVKYDIYRDINSGFTPDSSTLIQSELTTTYYVDANIFNGVTYYYRIKVYNCNGNSQFNTDEASGMPNGPIGCDHNDTTPPDWADAGISHISVVDTTENSITLSWDMATDSENPDNITYDLYRDISSNVNTATSSLIATDLTNPSYTDSNLLAGITRYYKVVAKNCIPLSRLANDVAMITLNSNNDNDVENKDNVKIFPNPINLNKTKILNISSDNIINKIMLYDIKGNLIYGFNYFNKISDYSYNITLKRFSNGIYMIYIKTDSNHIIKFSAIK